MKSRSDDLFLNFLTQEKYRVLRHITIILILFSIIINNAEINPNLYSKPIHKYYILSFAYIVVLGMFYVNMYALIPKLLYKKYYLGYVIFLACILGIGFLFIKLFASTMIPHAATFDENPPSFLYSFINVSLKILPWILASTAIKLFQRSIANTYKINELETKALKNELKALKNQINPHFLFNMLNNLNVLIRKDQEKASQVTIKLSDFLRHHLYENNKPLVYLDTEIKFLNDFLALEKIRRDLFTYEINFEGHRKPNIQIPPNIFTIFVENAVKHSLDSNSTSSIVISFSLDSNFIIFNCLNTKPLQENKNKKKGLGLQNVKRRLDLLYNKQYQLHIEDAETFYNIELKLPL